MKVTTAALVKAWRLGPVHRICALQCCNSVINAREVHGANAILWWVIKTAQLQRMHSLASRMFILLNSEHINTQVQYTSHSSTSELHLIKYTTIFAFGDLISTASKFGDLISDRFKIRRFDFRSIYGVPLKMRWIPPKSIFLGSPPHFPGKYGWSAPRVFFRPISSIFFQY